MKASHRIIAVTGGTLIMGLGSVSPVSGADAPTRAGSAASQTVTAPNGIARPPVHIPGIGAPQTNATPGGGGSTSETTDPPPPPPSNPPLSPVETTPDGA